MGDRRSFPVISRPVSSLAESGSTDPTEQMPPPAAGKPLSAVQIKRLEDWISQGAVWQEHWAFLPPQRTPTPAVRDQDWVKNPIDAFILARLEREGLSPSPERGTARPHPPSDS